MKKIISLALSFMMVLSMCTTAFAAAPKVVASSSVANKTTNGEVRENGTITITGIHLDSYGHVDTQYDVYKMLHLESYKAGSGGENDAYSYVIVEEWEEFFISGAGSAYITINEGGYVTWTGSQTSDALNAFSLAALAYAEAEGIDPVKSSATSGAFDVTDTRGVFSDLTLGYYLIDSNVGILCGLTTTNPNATVIAKNGAPTLEKQVQEDSAEASDTASWFEHNTADIGQTVNFDVTINVHAGAEGYIFHDKMDDGLDFNSTNLTVIHYNPSTDDKTPLVKDTDYTLKTSTTDGCDFEIEFSQTFCNALKTNDKIYITYQATLNEDAVVGGAGNVNEAWLDYGDGHHTTHDTTTTYTYGFDLVKTNSANKLIDGAQFQLYDHATDRADSHLLKFVLTSTGTYRLATADDDSSTYVSTITVTNGMVEVQGLDNGTYYLVETQAPTGYNMLGTAVTVSISDAYRKATVTGDTLTSGNPVQVVNNTGAMLPSTGGMGTVMFITCGSIVVLAAGVLLVTKKRMSMIQD